NEWALRFWSSRTGNLCRRTLSRLPFPYHSGPHIRDDNDDARYGRSVFIFYRQEKVRPFKGSRPRWGGREEMMSIRPFLLATLPTYLLFTSMILSALAVYQLSQVAFNNPFPSATLGIAGFVYFVLFTLSFLI